MKITRRRPAPPRDRPVVTLPSWPFAAPAPSTKTPTKQIARFITYQLCLSQAHVMAQDFHPLAESPHWLAASSRRPSLHPASVKTETVEASR